MARAPVRLKAPAAQRKAPANQVHPRARAVRANRKAPAVQASPKVRAVRPASQTVVRAKRANKTKIRGPGACGFFILLYNTLFSLPGCYGNGPICILSLSTRIVALSGLLIKKLPRLVFEPRATR
jgi:hypothetical protein